MQLSYYRGAHYNADKRLVKNVSGVNQHTKEVSTQNENKPQNQKTSERLAEQYNVSRATISRDAEVARAVDAIGDASSKTR
ncbi:MAG: helix-turn-helix domain-containing protein [Oscillospiraceae bacterium]|nr:helix-turn-helix domain-containing protein [Oscillospiraceae bacterium]